MKDLDRWIAEKVMGIDAKMLFESCGKLAQKAEREDGTYYFLRNFNCTTSLKLAFEAAWEADLWGKHEGRLSGYRKRFSKKFCVRGVQYDPAVKFADNLPRFSVDHENPATAICLTIYKLKTGKDWSDK